MILHLTSPFQDILIFDFFHKISEKLFNNLQRFSDIKTASKRFLMISDFIEVRVGKLGIVVREKMDKKLSHQTVTVTAERFPVEFCQRFNLKKKLKLIYLIPYERTVIEID